MLSFAKQLKDTARDNISVAKVILFIIVDPLMTYNSAAQFESKCSKKLYAKIYMLQAKPGVKSNGHSGLILKKPDNESHCRHHGQSQWQGGITNSYLGNQLGNRAR